MGVRKISARDIVPTRDTLLTKEVFSSLYGRMYISSTTNLHFAASRLNWAPGNHAGICLTISNKPKGHSQVSLLTKRQRINCVEVSRANDIQSWCSLTKVRPRIAKC